MWKNYLYKLMSSLGLCPYGHKIDVLIFLMLEYLFINAGCAINCTTEYINSSWPQAHLL